MMAPWRMGCRNCEASEGDDEDAANPGKATGLHPMHNSARRASRGGFHPRLSEYMSAQVIDTVPSRFKNMITMARQPEAVTNLHQVLLAVCDLLWVAQPHACLRTSAPQAADLQLQKHHLVDLLWGRQPLLQDHPGLELGEAGH